ncbi:MAG: hypothetical protein KC619_16310 [Myxococcales bacterium]|nr:hypothetical protein [Myxococcales bacterium]
MKLDGQPEKRALPDRYAKMADLARRLARNGFFDAARIDEELENDVRYVLGKERRAREEHTGTPTEDADHEEAVTRLFATVSQIARDELRALRTATPPEPWVNARITQAFAALSAAGIVALENPGGTPSAAWSGVVEEAERRRRKGEAPWGACFYHGQDVDEAVRGKGLYLDHSTLDPQPDERVTRAILEALEAHGVAAEWSGDLHRRIRVLPFEWFRRPPS